MARYWFVLGIWWRQRQGKPTNDLHSSVHRRVFAGFQMGFMSAVLWPIMLPTVSMIAGTLFGIPTMPRLMSLVIVFSIGFDIASQGINWGHGSKMKFSTFTI
ncbi:MAG: hypothetical protein GY943_30890 [Chloroflexi bacterium]|nr:hypothetical protein [Chloroflexota bacterium]